MKAIAKPNAVIWINGIMHLARNDIYRKEVNLNQRNLTAKC